MVYQLLFHHRNEERVLDDCRGIRSISRVIRRIPR